VNVRLGFNLAFALVSAAMLGLAAGAVWMLASVYEQHKLPWLALPIGWALALGIRRWIRPPGRVAAALAAIATLLAAGYVSLLTAAAQISSMLGIELTDVMHTAGLGMLLSLTRFSLSASTAAWFVAGAIVAAWFAKRRPPALPAPGSGRSTDPAP